MMKKQTVSSVPVSLTGFFVNDDDSENEEETEVEEKDKQDQFENENEVTKVTIGGVDLEIRQMAWHRANANQIWPGTFTLMDQIIQTKDTTDDTKLRYRSGKILELGAATGALSIALAKSGFDDILTSDIDDQGEVEENIRWNYEHNQLIAPRHIAHTWGSGWTTEKLSFKFIIASDILLYVSAYPHLVQSLKELFTVEDSLIEFLMSWNRRIAESSQFFGLMKDNGFECYPYGKGLYSFYLKDRMDNYLIGLDAQENHDFRKTPYCAK